MRLFFKSKRFIVIAAIALVLAIIILICSLTGAFSPQSNFFSSLINPVQTLCANVSGSVGSFFENIGNNQALKDELKIKDEKIAELENKMTDYEKVVRQNDFYKDFLGVKEDNPSFEFCASMIIAHDTSDPYKSFTIDKGTLDGVSVYDPVITPLGLVGYVVDAYSTQSVVMTILNPSINVSALDNRTRDTGNISGQADYAAKGMTVMEYVNSSNTMASGDYIITSGAGGIFPSGLIIGNVDEVKQSQKSVSCFATINPIVKIDKLSDVMVVTDFKGKQH